MAEAERDTRDLDRNWATQWVRLAAQRVAERRQELNDLDRAIGDGDHGENLERGFNAVVKKLDADPNGPATSSEVLRLVATTLISTVGGAAGPLYGTAFLRAATAIKPDDETDRPLDGAAIVALIEAALGGIVARGKAQTGEKTMVDAWTPALSAAQEALEAQKQPSAVLKAAAAAARDGAAETEFLQATKGRASYLGERSVGHIDPGATSSALILQAAYDATLAAP